MISSPKPLLARQFSYRLQVLAGLGQNEGGLKPSPHVPACGHLMYVNLLMFYSYPVSASLIVIGYFNSLGSSQSGFALPDLYGSFRLQQMIMHKGIKQMPNNPDGKLAFPSSSSS